MLGNTAYAIANKKITGVATGFDHALRTGDNTFSVFFIDGSKVDLTIPLPANGVNGTDGQDGQDGVSVTGYTLIDDTHLVWDFSDGTQSSQMEIPEQIVNISQESGNALVQKADGLFVGSTGVEVSSETDNAIEEKADGLYVKKTTDAAISQESGNALVKKEDGLYVGASAVEISEEEGNAIVEKADGLYVSDVSGVEIVETGETVSGDANFWVDENEDTEVVGTIATKEYCDSFIQAIKDITGDVADFTRADWTNLVQAINYTYGAGAASFNYDNTDKKLVITTRSGQTVNVNLSSIITDTKIEELKDVNVNAVENGQLLGYHAASQTWKNVTINLSQVLNDAKDYTDMKFQAIEHADAIAVDEKPVDEGSKIVYVKDGVTKETTNYNTWFYYTADEKTVQTIFVDGMEFTLDVAGGVDFSDYVTQTQITSTMQDVDKTKVPNLTALYEVHTNVTSELGKKLDKAQGNANAGKVFQVGSDGNVGLTDVDTLLHDSVEEINSSMNDIVSDNGLCHNLFDGIWNLYEPTEGSTSTSYIHTNKINCKANDTIDVSVGEVHYSLKVYFFNSSDSVILPISYADNTSSITAKAPSGASYCRFVINEGLITTKINTVTKVKIIKNKVDLAGIKEHLQSVDVNEKGLELFGYIAPKISDTVFDSIDENGVYHKKVGRVKIIELDDIRHSDNILFFNIPNKKIGLTNILIKGYSLNKTVSSWSYISDKEYIGNSNDKYVFIIDSKYSSLETFKNGISDTYVYYELDTEVTKSIYSENALDGINSSLHDLEFLGWEVPSECPVQNYVDAQGNFHQKVGRIDLSTLAFADDDTTSKTFFTTNIRDSKLNDMKLKSVCYCSKYSFTDENYTYVRTNDKTFTTNYSDYTNQCKFLLFRDTSYTDATAFKNAMSGVYLYYELATEKVIKAGNEAVQTLNNSLTNVKSTSVSNNNVTAYGSIAMNLKKVGNLVQANFVNDFSAVSEAGWKNNVFTIPTGYKPIGTVSDTIISSTNKNIPVSVYNGQVNFYMPSASAQFNMAYANLVWITNE